jgi:hypothetical protein
MFPGKYILTDCTHPPRACPPTIALLSGRYPGGGIANRNFPQFSAIFPNFSENDTNLCRNSRGSEIDNLQPKKPCVGYQSDQNLICDPKNLVLLKFFFETPLFGFVKKFSLTSGTVHSGAGLTAIFFKSQKIDINFLQFFRNFPAIFRNSFEGLRYQLPP